MAAQTEEGWFSPDARTRLYTKTWTPPENTSIKARLAFVHGFSDHCNAYYNFFPALATRGIAVYAFDQRGWGRSVSSTSERGNSGPTTTVLADIRSFLDHVNSQSPTANNEPSPGPTPLFLMGHSMGGAEVLLLSLLLQQQQQQQPAPNISGILLGSPYIALHPSAQPHAVTVFAGKLASKVLPKRQMLQKLQPAHICRDPQVCRDWEADELCHDTGTLEGLAGMLQRAADLTILAKGQTLRDVGKKPSFGAERAVPVWIGHGTEDRVTSCSLSQAIFDRLEVEDKTLKLYEGAYHKLHAEPDGGADDFANDVATWILKRTELQNLDGPAGDEVKPKL